MNHEQTAVDRTIFLEAMRSAVSSVTVVTTDGPGGRAGLTLSAMCSLSADPPAVLVCIHRDSPVLEAIRKNRNFCVNLLGLEHRRIADVFAGRVPELRQERFACAQWAPGRTGAPMLKDALAALECELAGANPYASHEIVIGRVLDICMRQQDPLLYMDRSYHGVGSRCNFAESPA